MAGGTGSEVQPPNTSHGPKNALICGALQPSRDQVQSGRIDEAEITMGTGYLGRGDFLPQKSQHGEGKSEHRDKKAALPGGPQAA